MNRKKIKILFILSTLNKNYGGPVFVVNKYIEKLKKYEIECYTFPYSNKYKHLNIFPPFGIKLTYFPGLQSLNSLKKLIQWYDLVHVHGLWSAPTSIGAFLCRHFKKPYIITPHGMLDEWSLKQNKKGKKIQSFLIEKKNINLASSLHFFNEEEYRQAKKFGIKAPTFILPNGIDVKEFDNLPPKNELIKKYPFLKNKIVLLFLGRIHYKKGFDILIPAFANSLKENKNLFLIIAGPDDGYKERVLELISEFSVNKFVHFSGFVDGENKKLLLGGSDIFVLPSYQEGDSIAIKEAMASGLPVIISPYCHLNEIEKHNVGIISDLNVKDLSEKILTLSQNTDLRKQMGENAKKFVRLNFDWNKIIVRLVSIYENLIYKNYLKSML